MSAVTVLAVSRLRRSLRVAAPAPRKYPGITIPTATQARYRHVGRLYLGGDQKRRNKDMVGRGEEDGEKCSFPLLHLAFFSLFSPQRKLLSLVSR